MCTAQVVLDKVCVFQLFNIGSCAENNQNMYVLQPRFFFCFIGRDWLYGIVMH
jgi:hypothetical protein